MELLKLLSASEIFAQVVSFLILLFVLRIFLWKRILKVLDDRKEKIASEFKGIEEGKLEVEKLKSDYEAKLKTIEDTAKAKIQEAINEGEEILGKMRKDAQEEGRKVIEDAKAGIKYEIAKAREDLKDEIIGLVLSAAEEVLQQKITEKEDKKVVEDFIERVDKVQ
ncbi:MAG: F0F1 ATP synthase subunit B [Candidatus Omnitrophica bacterium]|nr:F0F1 ATP synthase subunit B [Candidatus Omnitrophota bacterium]